MVIPLAFVLRNQSAFLQEVLVYLSPLDRTELVKMYVDVFPESRGIVVADGFGVPERLQDRVSFQDLLFDPGMLAADGG